MLHRQYKYHVVLCCVVLCCQTHVKLCATQTIQVPCCFVLCYVVLCCQTHVKLCVTQTIQVPCCAVLCCVVLLDTRKALCYTDNRDDRCLNPSTIPVTRSTCCCMVDSVEPVRIGWGQPCTVCPPVDLEEYQLLCPYGPGLTNTGAGHFSTSSLPLSS